MLVIGMLICQQACDSSKSGDNNELSLQEKESIEMRIQSALKERSIDVEGFYTSGKAQDLIDDYIDYSNRYPQEESSQEYLFRAAQELHGGLAKPHEALKILGLIEGRYSDDDMLARVLFFKAYIYENSLQELGKAGDLYDEVITKYPSSEFATQASAAKEYLGMSAEEIIEQIEK